MIHSGPFAGYVAIFDANLPGSERVRVLLKFLQNRQLLLELPAAYVRSKKNSALLLGKADDAKLEIV